MTDETATELSDLGERVADVLARKVLDAIAEYPGADDEARLAVAQSVIDKIAAGTGAQGR